MMLYTKYESSGPCSFGQEDFWKLHLKTYFLTLWPISTINLNRLNNFDSEQPRNHSCEVWSNSHKRFKSRCRLKFYLYNSMLNCDPWGGVNLNPRGIILTTLVEDLEMMLYTKYESSGPCSFRREDFFKLHFENLFIDPVTYLCNQLERFEQLW